MQKFSKVLLILPAAASLAFSQTAAAGAGGPRRCGGAAPGRPLRQGIHGAHPFGLMFLIKRN
jgi:hypothetical protein